MRIVFEKSSHSFNCRMCNANISHSLVHFESVPLVLGCSDGNKKDDKFIDYRLFICPQCHLIQTNAKFNEDIYTLIHSFAVGKVWEDHRRCFADFILKEINGKDINTIVEIGPSATPISRSLSLNNAKIFYFDFFNEAPFILKENERYTRSQFPLQKRVESDLFVASHVFEHSHNPYKFIEEVVKSFKCSGCGFFSIPNFEYWISSNFWNAFSYEHVIYPFKEDIINFSKVFNIFIQFGIYKNHSLFFCFNTDEPQAAPAGENDINKKTVYIEKWVNNINLLIKKYELKIKERSDVFITGASHLAQYCGLMSEKILNKCKFVLDNAKEKHDKRLYGTSITVKPFDIIKNSPCPVVIIPPSPYMEEMKQQLVSINSNVSIVSG